MENAKTLKENAPPEPSIAHPDANGELNVSKSSTPLEDPSTPKENQKISLGEIEASKGDPSDESKEENSEVKIVARPSPEDEDLSSVSSPAVRNISVSQLIAKVPFDSIKVPRSIGRSKQRSQSVDLTKVNIDTAAPIESVKAAVSMFGGIVDWKAHRVQTVERRKFIEQELEKAQEDLPSFKKQSEAAEESKAQVLKDLESTKRLIEELKLNLERAQTEEHQAKQDSELAILRVEELEQGIADEASFAAKAQLEVARARHAAAVSELKTVKNELEQLKGDYSLLVSEKDVAVKRAEEAVMLSKEVEKSVEDLTIEFITVKESLESAHAAHLEAEENRNGVVLAKEKEDLDWENELKKAEEELEKLNKQIFSTKDLKAKVDTATALLHDLKSELAAYMESKLSQEFGGEVIVDLSEVLNEPEKKTREEIQSAVASAKKELEEVRQNIEKVTDEVKILKVAATSLKIELEKEKSEVSEIQQREEKASIAVSSLENEINATKSEIDVIRMKEKNSTENMVELPKKLQEGVQEADEVKLLTEKAREELRMAKEEAEKAKAEASLMESRLAAARKEIEAAKASEKLALAAINALQESEMAQKDNNDDDSPNGVTLSLEEYYELSKKTHEAEEEANARVAAAMSEIESAKNSELRSVNKLEEIRRAVDVRKGLFEIAVKKAESAQEGKLCAEQELRKWRAESEQRRKAGEFDEGKESKYSVNIPEPSSGLHQRASPRAYLNTNSNSNVSNAESESSSDVRVGKKKKRSFFPRIFMFLARRKAQANKSA